MFLRLAEPFDLCLLHDLPFKDDFVFLKRRMWCGIVGWRWCANYQIMDIGYAENWCLAVGLSKAVSFGGGEDPIGAVTASCYYLPAMNPVILIIVLLLLFGGGGFYFGGPATGGGGRS